MNHHSDVYSRYGWQVLQGQSSRAMWVWVADTKKAMCTYMPSVLQQTYVLPQPQSHLRSIQQMGELRETEAREKSQVKTKSWELRHKAL